MVLALSGFGLVATFMILIMTRRLSAIAALILVPLFFAVLLGAGPQTGAYVLDGLKQVAPTAILLIFAILYFGLMIDVGLFDPLVGAIVRWASADPLKVTLGHTALSAIVALDGDGTTTILVCTAAMLPLYKRLGMNPLIFATLGVMCGTLMNLTPWGGPSARVAAALKVSPIDLFVPMLPAIGVGLLATFALAWWFGVSERKRLGKLTAPVESQAIIDQALTGFQRDEATLRPGRIWLNLALTLGLLGAVILHLAPPQVLFMGAFALALVVNYPSLADQRARIVSHAGGVLNVSVMVLAAGVFTGVLVGTGMIAAMAHSVVAVLPPSVGPYMGTVTALLSLPLTFFLSNDAYYFGVVPVIAHAGGLYGLTPEEIGRASLLGQPVHGLSPLVAAVYLQCALLGVELADLQRFVLKWAVAISLITIIAAGCTGAFPFVAKGPVPHVGAPEALQKTN